MSAIRRLIFGVALALMPVLVLAAGAPGFRTSQTSVDTTSGGVRVAVAQPGRLAVTIVNHGTTVVYVGNRGVTTSTGVYLAGVAGAAVTIATQDEVYAITGGGSQTVSVLESY